MTTVRPFRAVRYDPNRVELSDVIVPPYDVIAADERELFYERDPHNAIRFELTRDVADEASANYEWLSETLAAWRASGVLVQEDGPVFYVMSQRFTAPTGQTLERVGFFGELGLEDYDARIVRPHERTLAGPKADRLKLLRAARANLSSVFLLYEDREQLLTEHLARALETQAVGSARDDAGVEYTLARLSDPDGVAAIRSFMDSHPTVIADGHHRYETALAYRDERRNEDGNSPEADCESTLAYFANAFSPGSLLLPIHRVVRADAAAAPGDDEWRERLPDWESEKVAVSSAAEIQLALDEHLAPHAKQPSFAADDGSGSLRIFWKSTPLEGELMVRIAERDILGGVFGLEPDAIREGAVSFPKSAERAAREVRDGTGSVALYLNALEPDDVFRVTGAGEVMPQKSTFFYPKVPTGMVFRVHGEGE